MMFDLEIQSDEQPVQNPIPPSEVNACRGLMSRPLLRQESWQGSVASIARPPDLEGRSININTGRS
jgi:hypothetical protein